MSDRPPNLYRAAWKLLNDEFEPGDDTYKGVAKDIHNAALELGWLPPDHDDIAELAAWRGVAEGRTPDELRAELRIASELRIEREKLIDTDRSKYGLTAYGHGALDCLNSIRARAGSIVG